MCEDAPTTGPLHGYRPGADPLVSSALESFFYLQPIHAHLYLQHPSTASEIEDALASAQAEAAIFEKMQKIAQETTEHHSVLFNNVTRFESVKPASMLTAHPEAFPRPLPYSNASEQEGTALTSWQTMLIEDPWTLMSEWETLDQPQSSTTKKERAPPPTPLEMPWNQFSIFDESDAVSFKEMDNGLSDLVFSTPSATSLGYANSEVTSAPPLMNPFPILDECKGPLTSTCTSPLATSGGLLSYGSEDVLGFRQTADFGQGPMGCTRQIMTTPHSVLTRKMNSVNPTARVSSMNEMLKPHASFLASYKKDAKYHGETAPALQLVGGKTRQGSRHPGVSTVRKTRQPSARPAHMFSSECRIAKAEALAVADDARGQEVGTQVPHIPQRGALSLIPSTDVARAGCMLPGCTRRTSFGFIPGIKDGDTAGTCHERDKRSMRSLNHAEDGTKNVKMPRCRHLGCKLQPRFGDAGLKNTKTCSCNHALPGKKDLRVPTCQGAEGSCTKRPSYGIRGVTRPTRCSSHKEPGMEDLISARCNFPCCRKVASYGVQAPGSDVILRTCCKAHQTPEMTCGTRGPACTAPEGCETRPSYGWPNKFDGEHTIRPERCKKHLLLQMVYMGSAARAHKKRALETVKQEPALVVLRPATHVDQKAETRGSG